MNEGDCKLEKFRLAILLPDKVVFDIPDIRTSYVLCVPSHQGIQSTKVLSELLRCDRYVWSYMIKKVWFWEREREGRGGEGRGRGIGQGEK